MHLTINDRGEISSFFLSPGNVDDRDERVTDRLCRELWGKLFGEGGYISRELFGRLYRREVKLIRRLKKNMKNRLMKMEEKVLIRKQAVIESVNDFLKNICRTGHSRHRSFTNFMGNLFGAL